MALTASVCVLTSVTYRSVQRLLLPADALQVITEESAPRAVAGESWLDFCCLVFIKKPTDSCSLNPPALRTHVVSPGHIYEFHVST